MKAFDNGEKVRFDYQGQRVTGIIVKCNETTSRVRLENHEVVKVKNNELIWVEPSQDFSHLIITKEIAPYQSDDIVEHPLYGQYVLKNMHMHLDYRSFSYEVSGHNCPMLCFSYSPDLRRWGATINSALNAVERPGRFVFNTILDCIESVVQNA